MIDINKIPKEVFKAYRDMAYKQRFIPLGIYNNTFQIVLEEGRDLKDLHLIDSMNTKGLELKVL